MRCTEEFKHKGLSIKRLKGKNMEDIETDIYRTPTACIR